MANPRKFSEKIALQKQKQAEGTAEFEKIMKEVHATKMDESQAAPKMLECCYGENMGKESVVNSNNCNIGQGNSGTGSTTSAACASPEPKSGGGGSPTAYRESRGRSVGVGPMRRPSERKQDRSPYGSSTNTNAIGTGLTNNVPNIAYLSPPIDSNWRRSNSDSALHQSLNINKLGEGNFGGVVASVVDGLIDIGGMTVGTLSSNYQPHHITSQRSQSSNIGSSFSPQAHRRNRGNLMQQQQQHQNNQQNLEHQLQLHIQQNQELQQQHQNPHFHQTEQMQHQTPPNYYGKFPICTNVMISNSLSKSIQDQTMALANTGSLPDLTSVHYSQQQQSQQQHTMSPSLSAHNNGRDRDQSPSPFNPAGTGNRSVSGSTSPYQQQQSPTSSANTPVIAQATSPHLAFTNLSVQSPTPIRQQDAGSYGNLTTLATASSTGNLTDYRQPLNPPSPGSSPGLLTSTSGNEVHTSAPASPTRHQQTSVQNRNPIFNRYTTAIEETRGGNGRGNIEYSSNPNASANVNGRNHIDSSYNNLNSSFHNHFEQFSLGDSNSSPDRTHFESNNFSAFEFDDFVIGGNFGSQNVYSQSLGNSKILDFNNLISPTSEISSSPTHNATMDCNNVERPPQQRILSNNGIVSNDQCHPNNNDSSGGSGGSGVVPSVNSTNEKSPLPTPLRSCMPSPSSPLPIPMSTEQDSPHKYDYQQHAPNHHHQISLSLHSQNSPQHSPMHSPHHTTNSPLSASSPGGMTTMGGSGGIISIASTSPTSVTNSEVSHQINQLQQSSAANTPTANIPSIIFSDYSSNSDFSREILENLDLDLEQIDVAGLQMISDPTIEDGFRRDLN